MKPSAFVYTRAESLDDVFAAFAEHGDDARLLAGGQSLMPILNMRLAEPDILVDINDIDELNGVAVVDGHLRVGALTRHRELASNADIAAHAPLLRLAAPHIAHPAIRNRGTFGGSLCHADPAAELPACVIALSAKMNIAGPGGTRTVAATDFIEGIFDTCLADDEILTSVDIPLPGDDQVFGFDELARRHGDYAIAGLAASATRRGTELDDLRLVYFSVADRAVLASQTMAAVTAGGDTASALAADLADAMDDLHSSAATKRHLAGVLLDRVLDRMRGGDRS